MATSVIGQQSHSMIMQHSQSQMHRSQSNTSELISPSGDLGDVEADFQRMVNEMAQDNIRTTTVHPAMSAVSFTSTQNATTRSMKQCSSMSTKPQSIAKTTVADRVVPQSPVRAANASSSEVVCERTTRVRDQIKKIERQHSQEEIISAPETAAQRPTPNSIKYLSDQFERPNDTTDYLTTESTANQQPNAYIGNERGFASGMQEVSSNKYSSADNLNQEGERRNFSGFDRTASNQSAYSSVNQFQASQSYAESSHKYQDATENKQSAENELEKSLDDISKCTKELSRSLSASSSNQLVAKPLQYSAHVKCEVKSRINAPDHQVRNISAENKSETRQSRFDAWSSSSSTQTQNRTVSSSNALYGGSAAISSVSEPSHFCANAPTPLARTGAKPPIAESGDKVVAPKFSLLRSASAGSVAAVEDSMRIMNRTTSDKDLPKFSVKKINSGSRVWSPGSAPVDHSGLCSNEHPNLPSFKDVPPVWTPARGGSASPGSGKREYRKISFDGPTVPKRAHQENREIPRPEDSFAWQGKSVQLNNSESLHLPRTLSPTVTILQKKREGLIQDHKAEYLQTDASLASYKQGDKLYTIKKEYESEDEDLGTRKFAVLGPRKVEGVGPVTKEGMPMSLKTGVKSEHQGEWYRRMFDSLHKTKDVRYGGGYMSEPETYDSDAGITRYAKYDRSKNEFEFENPEPAAPRKTKRYVHQPGRIEDYVPGFSSLSERELKANPLADVKLEITTPRPSRQTFQGVRRLGGGYKESGYDSDSTLVFKKREDTRRKVETPRDTSEVYREIQKGGDIPYAGLQRPAPRARASQHNKYDTSEVNIHYRTPIRVERKDFITDEELARRQEEHMQKVYEQERRKKYLSELEDIERRRHTDNFTPLQKSPIPLNRYDDESYGGLRGFKTPEPRQLAKALFGFHAQNKRELNFNKGDILTIRRHIDKNWMEGEFKGNIGIFPSNYVEVLPYDNFKTTPRRPTEGQGRVRFNFQAQTSMEMSLNKGEIIVLIRKVDENWFEGRIATRKGIFPVSYVDVLQEPLGRDVSPIQNTLSRPELPPAHLLFNGTSSVNSPYSTMGHQGNESDNKTSLPPLTLNTQQEPTGHRALYNYKPQNDDELELLEGDVVMVMEKCDDGWFVGTSQRTNLFGTFPGNYVEKI